MSYARLPSADEILGIRTVIRGRREELAGLHAQISAFQRQIDALRINCEQVEGEIAAAEQVIAPVRRLPDEIIGEVVTLCALDDEADAQVLRTLSSICKLWRDVTLSTPRAW
ncbi:hypothetical protein EXIGLDRAFT_612082, partial [Exidia glandulosa HHB12029]